MIRPHAIDRLAHLHGFSLVEMMLCLTVVAILAALTVGQLRITQGEAVLRSALARLEAQDRLMRDRTARLRQTGMLIFDLRTGEAARLETTLDGKQRRTPIFAGGKGPCVEQIRLLGQPASSDGRYQVKCGAQGRTISYALLVKAGQYRQWVMVSGLSGEVMKVEDEAEIQTIFAKAARSDAR